MSSTTHNVRAGVVKGIAEDDGAFPFSLLSSSRLVVQYCTTTRALEVVDLLLK